jgi:hypothetical protein
LKANQAPPSKKKMHPKKLGCIFLCASGKHAATFSMRLAARRGEWKNRGPGARGISKKTFAKCLTKDCGLIPLCCELIDSRFRLEIEMKFYVRRFFAGLLTLPVALAGYFVLYALLVMLGTGPVGSWRDAVANFPMLSFTWMILWLFLPQIWRWIDAD